MPFLAHDTIATILAEPPDKLSDVAVNSKTPADGSSAVNVIWDFRRIDINKNGEITQSEFVDALRSSENPGLAQKFGLSDDTLCENGSRAKYEEVFAKIDDNQTTTVNVCFPQPNTNCLLTRTIPRAHMLRKLDH